MNTNGNSNRSAYVDPPTQLMSAHMLAIAMAGFTCSLSIVFQNAKGFAYIVFLFVVSLVYFIILYVNYRVTHATANDLGANISETMPILVSAFTVTYMLYPMFATGQPNYWLVVLLLLCFVWGSMLTLHGGFVSLKRYLLVVLGGCASAIAIVTSIYASGAQQKILFYSNKSNATDDAEAETDARGTNQTFRCAVYKNGQLVGGQSVVQ